MGGIVSVSHVRGCTADNGTRLRQIVLNVNAKECADALALGGIEQVYTELLECVTEVLERPFTEEELQ